MSEMAIKNARLELGGRLFNVVKLRDRLLTADALLRPIAQFWILTSILIATPTVYNPLLYPVHMGYLYSSILFVLYYGLIDVTRRSTETYLEKLANVYEYDLRSNGLAKLRTELAELRPFKETDDPPIVKFLFEIARKLHLPRRGLIQQTVVCAQLIFLVLYGYNYVRYFGTSSSVNFPDMLWMLHGSVTLYGIVMMMQNASFLLNNKFFLAVVRGVIDWKGSAGKAASSLAEDDSTRSHDSTTRQ